jgi:hypothetical protein
MFTVGIGACFYNTDADCVGRAGGHHCVGNVSTYRECGCVTAGDCAGDTNGHACVNAYDDG